MGDIKKTLALIPSAGMGLRMGSRKKNYLPLAGRPVLAHTLEVFERCPAVGAVIIIVPPGDEAFCEEEVVNRYGFTKVIKVAPGGSERQDSVANGVKEARTIGQWDMLAVHDGARPLVTCDIIERSILAARDSGAAICAVPVKDTIKEVSDNSVVRTVPRHALWSVQTPQVFRPDILGKAFEQAKADSFRATDESMLVERLGIRVKVVEGSYENIKITTPEDMTIAEAILKARQTGQ